LNIFNAKKSVGGYDKKSITSSFFNEIKFYKAMYNVSLNKTVKF